MEKKDNNQFWRLVFSVAMPVAFQSLLYSSLNILNQVMVGQEGDAAVVAVGLASKNFGILNFALMGLSGGLAILSAQLIGNKQANKIAKIQGMMLFAGLALTLVFVIVSLFFPTWSMQLFSKDPAVIREGVKYHQALALGYVPFLVIVMYSTVLRTAKIVKIPMYVSIAALPLNAALNYLLIFGNFGFPALGVQGSAIATTIAQVVEALILVGIVYIKRLVGAYSLKRMLAFFPFDMDIKLLWKLTLPLLATNVSFILADTVYASIYGMMGTSQTVAVTIMSPIQGLMISFFSGFATAASVIIGNSLGRDDKEYAYMAGKRILGLGLVLPFVMGLCLLLFTGRYLSIYHLSDYSYHLTQIMMVVMVVFVPIKVVNMVLVQGVLSSGGETKFLFYISILGLWCIGVPAGLLAAFVFRLPIYLVFVAISFEEFVRVIFGLRKMRSRTWLNNLVKQKASICVEKAGKE